MPVSLPMSSTQQMPSIASIAVARAAVALLALACAIVLLLSVANWVDGPDSPHESIPRPAAPAARPVPQSVDWGLFGEPVRRDLGFDEPVRATPLALRLRGVVTGERGYAIIVDADGNEGVYRVDDEVPGEAEVVGIEPRRVLLRRAGETEALELPGGGMSRTAAPRRTAATPQRTIGEYAGIGSLAGMASRFTLDPDALARQITILPVAGGGFRVRAGRDAELFTRLGFHANDVVTAINGQPVNTQADVRAIFEAFDPSSPIAITVRRGDRRIVLTPDLDPFSGAR
ncbi:MAG: type II secretion system protein N [Wenzhouxiangellaceae bacterium]|nr:type II secretion system protein N [Wenzhouxiangellaceae bacterium]